MPRIRVVGHRLFAGTKPWRGWGMNWGRGDNSPVLTYLDDPTAANLNVLACQLHTARRLGANSMRIPVELQQVMQSPSQARPRSLVALRTLLELAQSERIYLDITGNLVWRPTRAPDWYDRLPEPARWRVQAKFWRAVAHTASAFPAVLCYELSSEPTMSDEPGYYIGHFGGWTFIQIIAHPRGRDHRKLARAWTTQLAAAVRSQDDRPVTIGMLPIVQDGFSPANVGDLLNILVPHVYPARGNATAAVALVREYASFGKPVLVGETTGLHADLPTQRAFLLGANR